MSNRRQEFREKNLSDWEKIIKEIFGNNIPSNCSWEKTENIIEILNKIGSKSNSNHTMFASGGGQDLTKSNVSHEDGCIELNYSGLIDIIKPKKLTFYYLGDKFEWAYFRLEAEQLKPSGIYENLPEDFLYEELTEISPLKYVDRAIWEHGYYNGEPLPKNSRVISRYFSGTFLIVAKASAYNRISSTYDGRHNKMNNEEFKEYMLKIKEKIK